MFRCRHRRRCCKITAAAAAAECCRSFTLCVAHLYVVFDSQKAKQNEGTTAAARSNVKYKVQNINDVIFQT